VPTLTARATRDEAIAGYDRWLPLINFENRQCGVLRWGH
jgi:hypothetical protein